MVSSHSQPTRGESPMSTNRQPLPISSTRATTTAAAGIPHFHFPNSQICLRFHFPGNHRSYSSARTIQELLADVDREKHKEREEKKRAGLDTSYIDAEDQEDYMEPTDSDSDDDERFTPDAVKKTAELFEKKFKRHEDLLKNFTHAGGLDEDEFDDVKEKDDILLEKLNDIDKILEEKLAELDHAFGKKRKVLEEEIRDLAE
ncbi:ribosomal protein S5 family protein [Actinidia rufa]|uniref:Ribosomal protein S5 family protein n=1 Tax=Actinidia rufa TaxID=165716 RepID=A0A7J0F377_9ERIC|nr:ribosomal protein S5 family protein [Actinidia rufa]